MLSELRVENLGIIHELLVPFGPGLTAITGETGAGKTLLVEALDLLLGGRADAGLVRSGASEARVEARFASADDEVVLARVVPADGRSRAYVDGRLATAAELTARGRGLVDLHGQHDHQSLLQPGVQRSLLDRAVGAAAASVRERLRAARAESRRIDAELESLGGDERARAREADLLRYQIAEIDAAGVDDPAEEEHLEREEAVLADAEAHREALLAARALIERADDDAVGPAVDHLRGREPFAALADRLLAAQTELSDLARELRTEAESVVADPERLAATRSRRQQLRDLCRKYGASLAEVAAYRDATAERLASLERHDALAASLEAASRAARSDAADAADELSARRREACGPLEVAVTAALHELALPDARFEIRLEPTDPGDDGADAVTFLLAPNPGEDPRPLARAASGGELSRAMLSLRVVLSAAPPTLVFDEVDAGIGGAAGTAVGRALAMLGGDHQVLCVTHLAQVAAFADAHVAVAKAGDSGRTVASAALLLDDARVGELSRMLAGVGESAHARRHAAELLAAARDVRDTARTR